MTMRILVAGASGQVASALLERGLAGGIDITVAGRPHLDIGEPASIAANLDRAGPTVVINAAAYTAVDQAETDRDSAFRINAEGPGLLARACAERAIPILHLSTDYVFDGSSPIAYDEDWPVAPLGVYGASKLAGEIAVREANRQHYIFRTAWVYSPFGKNFVKTMLTLAQTRDLVSVVDDQIGSPTSALDIADALLAICQRLSAPGPHPAFGTYHLAGTGIASWADVARAVFAASAAKGGPWAQVRNIESHEFPTPTRRPANSRLDCARLQSAFAVTLPRWPDSLRACVDRLVAPCGDI